MSTKLYVGNLSYQTTADNLLEAFGRYGTVVCAEVASDRDSGQSKGFAFVEMSDGADAAVAALNGSQLGGRCLTVNEARPRDAGGRQGAGTLPPRGQRRRGY